MPDMEKVIKGLEYCLMPTTDEELMSDVCSHDDCPYYREYRGGQCVGAVARDALALLKGQEPHVMTLKEVIESEVGAVVWLEDIDKPTVIAGLVDRVFTGTMVVDFQCVARTVTAGFDDYGKHWRCWTSRPTEAQREATPWS